MSSLQFPPSSPVLDGPEPSTDFFKGKELPRGRLEYPTPNPSSTVGRSSSPERHEQDLETPEKTKSSANITRISNGIAPIKEGLADQSVGISGGSLAHEEHLKSLRKAAGSPKTVSINRDFNIVNPHALVLRVPLLTNQTSLTIGRSSQTCDFHFSNTGKPLSKAISRCHVKIEYPGSHMVVTCLGFNGLGMTVPRCCRVKRPSEHMYELFETDSPLASENVSKSVHLDQDHTEFFVSRGESVRMPKFANILLQIAGHVLLVNPDDYDEDVTDDESMSDVVKSTQNASKTSLTPITAHNGVPNTPQKVPRDPVLEEPTPSRSHKASSGDKQNVGMQKAPVFSRKLATPLSIKSTNVPEPSPLKRRAQSEEPQGMAKKTKRVQEYDANGELVINEQCLEGVSNIDEIENILINHLAFSRLSSTPASFLNTILAAVAKLTLEQLRVVLHKVACIGVIYRQGKDAAGKPLEEEYYYVPEKDRDPERNKLVSSVKGHGGLRACRKTHKQYYWKKPAPIKK